MPVVPLVATTLSPDEIAVLAGWAGWRGNDQVIATAVALSESGGQVRAKNYCCHGLWQVNVLAHPQYAIAQMEQAEPNAKAAYAIWRGSGWGAWQTYAEGSAGNGYLTHDRWAIAQAAVGKQGNAAFGPAPTSSPPGYLAAPSATPPVKDTGLDYSEKVRSTGKGASLNGNHIGGHANAIRGLTRRRVRL